MALDDGGHPYYQSTSYWIGCVQPVPVLIVIMFFLILFGFTDFYFLPMGTTCYVGQNDKYNHVKPIERFGR